MIFLVAIQDVLVQPTEFKLNEGNPERLMRESAPLLS
jgi:hypothetical protein